MLKSIVGVIAICYLAACGQSLQPKSNTVESTVENVVSEDSVLMESSPSKPPELVVRLDRERMRMLNVSTSVVASKVREIQIDTTKRRSIEQFLEERIQFRNNKARLVEIPIRSIIDTVYFQ